MTHVNYTVPLTSDAIGTRKKYFWRHRVTLWLQRGDMV